MIFKTFLIKYGEIGIKGKNRYLFEDALVKQIRHALKHVEGEFEVRKEQGRIYVDTLSDYEFDEVIEALNVSKEHIKPENYHLLSDFVS